MTDDRRKAVMEDHTIIEGMAGGDPAAFRHLVESFKKKVYFLALDMVGNPVDAEDVSQDVFLKVHRSFGTFKRDAKLGSWIYRITYNACIDHLRKRQAAPDAVEDDVLESRIHAEPAMPVSPSFDPVRTAEAGLLQDRISRALDKVSPQEKAVFLLRHYEDFMLKDIAKTLDLSVGSVKSYLFRAVKKLQKELGACGLTPGLEASHD
jgi:RNA polymerase sigma-70 factor (ECF subfamily)